MSIPHLIDLRSLSLQMGKVRPSHLGQVDIGFAPANQLHRRDGGAAGRLSKSPQRRPAEPTLRLRLAGGVGHRGGTTAGGSGRRRPGPAGPAV